VGVKTTVGRRCFWFNPSSCTGLLGITILFRSKSRCSRCYSKMNASPHTWTRLICRHLKVTLRRHLKILRLNACQSSKTLKLYKIHPDLQTTCLLTTSHKRGPVQCLTADSVVHAFSRRLFGCTALGKARLKLMAYCLAMRYAARPYILSSAALVFMVRWS